MDVLKPDITVIEGIRYRINPGDYRTQGDTSNDRYEDTYDQYEDSPFCEALSDGEEDIEQEGAARYKTSFHIPKTYFPIIIGSKGVTKKRLETETRSKIAIPKPGQDGDIIVIAPTKKNVASARRRIRLMVSANRNRRPITHFLSLPLNKPNFKNGFMNFKNEVIQKFGNDRGISEVVFQNPERLHLTIAVLVLSDENERNEAAAALQECKEHLRDLLQFDELEIEMRGVNVFDDENPSNARVLFGKVKMTKNDSLLQDIADGVNTFFNKKGLLVRVERGRVKLHCTLMNVKFSQKENTEEEEGSESTDVIHNFDVTNVLENYKDYLFGKDVTNTLELSILGSTGDDEYYRATSTITLP